LLVIEIQYVIEWPIYRNRTTEEDHHRAKKDFAGWLEPLLLSVAIRVF